MSRIGVGEVDRGVVDEDVQAVGDRLEQHLKARGILLIGTYRDHVSDLSRERVGRGLVLPVAEHDPRAIRGEPTYDRPADAPGAARHQCGLASECHGFILFQARREGDVTGQIMVSRWRSVR